MRAPPLRAVIRHPVSAGVVAAVLAPAASLPYLVAVHQFKYAYGIVPSQTQVLRFVVAVAVVGVLVSLALRWRLRGAVVTTGFVLVVFPWLGPSASSVDAGSGHMLLVVAAVALAVEAALRRHRQVVALLDRAAVAAGIAHVLVAFLVQMAVHPVNFSLVWVVVLLWGVIYSVVALILFATGALPVVLWRRGHLVTPAVAAVGWFSWGVYEIWRARESLPLTDFQAIRWTVPQPHFDYAFQSSTLLLVILIVAGLEYALRTVTRVATKPRAVEEG